MSFFRRPSFFLALSPRLREMTFSLKPISTPLRLSYPLSERPTSPPMRFFTFSLAYPSLCFKPFWCLRRTFVPLLFIQVEVFLLWMPFLCNNFFPSLASLACSPISTPFCSFVFCSPLGSFPAVQAAWRRAVCPAPTPQPPIFFRGPRMVLLRRCLT